MTCRQPLVWLLRSLLYHDSFWFIYLHFLFDILFNVRRQIVVCCLKWGVCHGDMILLTRTTFNLGVPIFRAKFWPWVLLELNMQDVQPQVQLMRPLSTRPMVLNEVQQEGLNSKPFLMSHQSQGSIGKFLKVLVCKVSPIAPPFQLRGFVSLRWSFYNCKLLEF